MSQRTKGEILEEVYDIEKFISEGQYVKGMGKHDGLPRLFLEVLIDIRDILDRIADQGRK
jgi:hypothetical protein